ncbi:MAG: amidohydrolase [Alphaproteobacteria bacterium]|nr:amidohydrolase [Alphaproteobacteria bacterium]
MAAKKKPYIIALEEHYQDGEVRRLTGGPGSGAAGGSSGLEERLDDLGALRLREMDESGIDFQVLSHSVPGLQAVDAASGVPLARRVNDRLNEAVRAHPDRFAAFAALPTADPRAAANELERTVTKLGFKGAMINGLTNSVFHDDERFWPIYERAAALDVPIYIHPAIPQPAVIEAYYKDYAQKHPGLLRAGWGFNVETATQGIRFVLSGVFDAYPGLKVILGHMGEGIPFYLWRISHGLRQSMSETTFRDIFCEHFWITTSGFFSDPALVCCMMEMGIDRILFSVDYPFMDNPPGAEWIKTLPLSAEDTQKLLNGNTRRLLKL